MRDTAIVVVSFQGRRHLPALVDSCLRHAPDVPLYVVDNASTDGSADLAALTCPAAVVLRMRTNRGFGAGVNAGLRAAAQDGARFVLVLNQDTVLTAGVVDRLHCWLARTPSAGAVQPAIVRPDGLVNSLGNPIHYLGFSWAGADGLPESEAEGDDALPWLHSGRWKSEPVQIPVCSGAAVMLRMEALDDVGRNHPRRVDGGEAAKLPVVAGPRAPQSPAPPSPRVEAPAALHRPSAPGFRDSLPLLAGRRTEGRVDAAGSRFDPGG